MFSSRLIQSLIGVVVLLAAVLLFNGLAPWLNVSAPYVHQTPKVEQIKIGRDSLHLQLAKDGTAWRIRSAPGSLAADPNKVKTLLENLENVRVQDVISERADRAGEFELDDARGTRVTLLDKNNKVLADGIFGKQAPDFSHIYFRYPDKPRVYLAQGMIRGELGNNTLRDWRDRQLVAWKEDRIQSIFIEGPDFKTALVKSSDTWTCNGKKADVASVSIFENALTQLRADDFVDPAVRPDLTPLALTLATVRVELVGGEKHQIRFGKPDPRDRRTPVLVDEDSEVAWIQEVQAQALLKKPQDFYVK